jgi:hypothetical protein
MKRSEWQVNASISFNLPSQRVMDNVKLVGVLLVSLGVRLWDFVPCYGIGELCKYCGHAARQDEDQE